MFENEDLRNEVTVDNVEEVNLFVVPEEVYVSEVEETEKEINGVVLGAAIAATGVVAYKYGPKLFNAIKSKFKNKTNETLEEKQTRLLAELAEVNKEIKSNEDENIQDQVIDKE